MAINKEPLLKKCKYLGISPMVMGVSKDTKRKADQGNRKKLSEYGMQLKEKQKLKFIYGVLEKQFYHYFEIAEKQQGQAGTNLITILESRLDNVVFRAGFATTRKQARQIVNHGHVLVNGKKVDIPSYLVKAGDEITVRAKSADFVKTVMEPLDVAAPQWMTVDANAQKIVFDRIPEREELDPEFKEQLVIEYYSK